MKIFVDRDMQELKESLHKAFTKIKDEFDDHRESINQNTNEIQANYEYICRLDAKIEKLSERIDELTMMMCPTAKKADYSVSKLTTREKEVFLSIYASENEISYQDVGRRTGLSENLVICYVSNLISKGVPVIKRYMDNVVVLSIDAAFKELQMRENILGINEALSSSVMV